MTERPGQASPIRPAAVSGFLVVASALVILRCLPLTRDYAIRFAASHGGTLLAAAAAAGVLALAAGVTLLRRRPKTLVALALGVAAFLLITSANAVAAAAAVLIAAGVLLLGDLVFRLFTGVEAEDGDAWSVFAAGVASTGILMLGMGEAGILCPGFVAGAFADVRLAPRFRSSVVSAEGGPGPS
ncbi:MAG: hypothetical protein LC796_02450 [Acidobacteria bacterium]|nr:hypothetical protein [Acidobacteriota bacterium]